MTVIETEPGIDDLKVVMGWSGVVLPVGVRAGELDTRTFFDPSWPPLPITLADNHWGDGFVGPIDFMEVIPRDEAVARLGLTPDEAALLGDENVWASGRFHAEDGAKVAGQLAFWGRLPVSIEVRDGEVVERIIEDPDVEIDPEIEDDWGTPAEVEITFTRTVIGAVAIERMPAFAGAWIRPDAEAAAFVPGEAAPAEEAPEVEADELSAAVATLRTVADPAVVRAAGAGPVTYPAAFFARPEDGFSYSERTRLTISPQGEITGHIVPEGAVSRTFKGDPWVAGRNPNDDLSEWLVGAAHLDDGRTVKTGVIVSDGLHGPAHQAGASGEEMRRLIESTACQVGQLTGWWDEFGLAVHGSTLPGVTPEQATRAMAGCPSVDERLFDGRGWMTTGVLCVNTCRFRPGEAMVRVASGQPVSRLRPASTGCGCGGAAGGSGGCSCGGTARSASAEDEEPKPGEAVGREAGRLARIDRDMDRERLRAAAQSAGRKA